MDWEGGMVALIGFRREEEEVISLRSRVRVLSLLSLFERWE
jgi:hypothetical protein